MNGRNKLIISGKCENNGTVVHCDDPSFDISINGAEFKNNYQDIDAPRMGSLEIENSKFSQTDERLSKKRSPGKYFGGFSFSKGDHLK